jgi:hypothetical protein
LTILLGQKTINFRFVILTIILFFVSEPLQAQQSNGDTRFKNFLEREDPEKREEFKKTWLRGIMIRAEVERAVQLCDQPKLKGDPKFFQIMLSKGRYWFGDKIIDDALQNVDAGVRRAIDRGDLARFCAATKLNELEIKEINPQLMKRFENYEKESERDSGK